MNFSRLEIIVGWGAVVDVEVDANAGPFMVYTCCVCSRVTVKAYM